MKRFFVDRIEEGVAICDDENGDEVRFFESDLPSSVCESCVIIYENGEFAVSELETERRRKEISEIKNI